MDYYVQPGITEPDTATWTDRETGSCDLSVHVKQENDGTPDAKHATTLTIDLDVAEGVYVVVNIPGVGTIEGEVN